MDLTAGWLPTTIATSTVSPFKTTLYTVPAGYRFILKCLWINNTLGTSATYGLSIGVYGSGTQIKSGETLAIRQNVVINCFLVIPAGTVIEAVGSAGSAINIAGGGVLEAI